MGQQERLRTDRPVAAPDRLITYMGPSMSSRRREIKCWADKACQGAGRSVRVPFRGRRLKRWKRRHNITYAKIRCVDEQAGNALKGWRLLRKLRCSINRITDIVKAVLVRHHASA